MPQPTSSNPNNTAGRASQAVSNLSYPLNELLSKRTVLRFVEYERPTAFVAATNTTTAIINLPMPIQIPETIQIKGGNTSLDFGVARALRIYNAGSGMSIADLTKTMANSFTDGEMPKSVARAVALNPLNFSDDRRTHGQVFGGVIKNPHTTAFFDGVQLRSYALTWKMSARSQNESDRINEILQTIRERILPEERYEGYALDFPDLVYVDFEGESKEYLPKYYKSFISDLTINTSSGDGMVFYKSGAPVTVEISCTFMETNIMTRNVLRGNSNG